MSMVKKMLVLPGTDFLRAYAGTQYLINEFHRMEVQLKIFIRSEKSMVGLFRSLPYDIKVWPYSVSQNPFIRKITNLCFQIVIFFEALAAKNVLTTESTYLRPLALAKRLKPSLCLIQFCQELLIPEDYPQNKYAQAYGRYARVPDIVIDVEPHRAVARKEKMGLVRDPFVLLNTMPLKNVAEPAPLGTLSRLAGVKLPEGIPVLLHAGGIGKEKPLERAIDAVALSKQDVFFLAFCNGCEADILRLSTYAKSKLKPGMFCIRESVPRMELMSALHEADIGIIDYAYSVEPTLNQKFCAPTKLFELMAHGVAVLGSKNDSLWDIVEGQGVGKCAEDDSVDALAQALGKLLKSPADLAEMKKRGPSLFCEQYSYEQICAPVIRMLIPILK